MDILFRVTVIYKCSQDLFTLVPKTCEAVINGCYTLKEAQAKAREVANEGFTIPHASGYSYIPPSRIEKIEFERIIEHD